MKKKVSFRKGLAFKMMLWIFSAVAGTFVTTFIYNYFETRDVVIKDLNLRIEDGQYAANAEKAGRAGRGKRGWGGFRYCL